MSPVPKGVDEDIYIANAIEELCSILIDPVQVKIKDALFEKDSNYDEFKSKTIWAIARRENNWLLLSEEKEGFALAFGDDHKSLTMHGFASSDALAEWLG